MLKSVNTPIQGTNNVTFLAMMMDFWGVKGDMKDFCNLVEGNKTNNK